MNLHKLKILGIAVITIAVVVTLGACESGSGPGEEFNGDTISEFQVIVLDEADDEIEDAEVTLAGNVETTNSDGLATFEDLSNGFKSLEVDHPGYQYSEMIEVSEEQSPYTAELLIDFELNSIPDSITSENNMQAQYDFPFDFWPTQTAEAWVAEDDYYEKLKHVILRSVVYMNNILIDEMDEWMEEKMEEIVNWEEGDIELPKVADLEKEELGYVRSELEKEDGETEGVESRHFNSLPTIEDSEYEVDLSTDISDDYDEIYDRKYEIEDDTGSGGLLYVDKNNTRVNFFDISYDEGEEVFGYQVIHDETENFTVIFTFNTLVMVREEANSLTYKYMQLENMDEIEDEDSNPHFAKMYGYEENGNMTAGIYYKAREVHDFSDFQFVADSDDEEEEVIEEILESDPEEQELTVIGELDGRGSFPIYDDEDHDFHMRDNFEAEEGYPELGELDDQHDDNMIPFSAITDLEGDEEEMRYKDDTLIERLGLYD